MTRAKPDAKKGSKAGAKPLKPEQGPKGGKSSTRARAKAPPAEPAGKAALEARPAKKAKTPAGPPAPLLPGIDDAPPVPFEQRVHPDPEVALEVVIQSAVGTPQELIAAVLGISTKTLHKHYKAELADGLTRANAVVGGVAFRQAAAGVEWAVKLWAAKRLGWAEAPKKIEATVRRIELIAPNIPMPVEDDDEAVLALDDDADEDQE